MALLIMMLQMATIFCPTLKSRQSLPSCTGVRSYPSDEEVEPTMSIENVIYTGYLHRTNDTACQVAAMHQRRTFPSGWNGSVGVDVRRRSCQGHPGGGLFDTWRQCHALRCILPSERSVAVSSRSVGLLI